MHSNKKQPSNDTRERASWACRPAGLPADGRAGARGPRYRRPRLAVAVGGVPPRFARRLTTDDVAIGWVRSQATRPPRLALLTPPPVMVEVVATKAGIAHYLIFTNFQRRMVLASLRAALPVRLDDAADYLRGRPNLARIGTSHRWWPLAGVRAWPSSQRGSPSGTATAVCK